MAPAPASVSPARGKRRLVGLDVLRGITMAVMLIVDTLGDLYPSIGHAPWDGLHLADLVMPYFLLISGISFHISLSPTIQPWTVLRRNAFRALRLFLLGLAVQGSIFHVTPAGPLLVLNLGTVRIMGILQRIAIVFLFVSLIDLFVPARGSRDGDGDAFEALLPEEQGIGLWLLWRTVLRWILVLLLVLLGTCLTYGAPPSSWPGCASTLYSSSDVVSLHDMGCSRAGWLDSILLGVQHVYVQGTSIGPKGAPNFGFDPEGLVTTLSATFPMFVGAHLGRSGRVLQRFFAHWLLLGTTFTAIGCWMTQWIPFNKRLWSPSYNLCTAGTGIFLYAALFFLCDREPSSPLWRKMTIIGTTALKPFQWLGANCSVDCCTDGRSSGRFDCETMSQGALAMVQRSRMEFPPMSLERQVPAGAAGSCGSARGWAKLANRKLYSAVPTIPGPEARSAHQAFGADGYLYVFGGEWSSRDQKRYRSLEGGLELRAKLRAEVVGGQFRDLWRFECSGAPGTRWEQLEAHGSVPDSRSGHRMATAGSYAVLFGGFSEDKKRRATYWDDFYALHLPSHTWRLLPVSSDRRARPISRAGGLLFAAASQVFLYGGSRPTRKGGDSLQILEDLWCARLGSDGGALWEQLAVQGEGPGKRSGLCQCALQSQEPLRRLVFGGVADHRVASNWSDGTKRAADVAVFHQDLFLLDRTWSADVRLNLWTPSRRRRPSTCQASVLPEELLARGGGADAACLALAIHQGGALAIGQCGGVRGE
ncbi:Heparan-alpha-glucosaminide N-acetyltransferase (Transmembrane protein 76) [Durusdinium trenchii]|uniref:Heparan-alpha-glucosaminide N-acetyltransferase (Transmembrane protein 76) n=1 Tax=Durusdinium trenchii TaxID=1381693 RepID=A0ABP0JGA4_9DINO